MPRKYVPIDEEKLREKLWDLGDSELRNKVKDDLKVKFDWENVNDFYFLNESNPIWGMHTIGDFTFEGNIAAGDWEIPVFFIVYWDGKKLRAYIPTDGNAWNTDTKQAYGNAEKVYLNDDYEVDYEANADMINLRKRYPEYISQMFEVEDIWDIPYATLYDYDKMLKDISNRFELNVQMPVGSTYSLSGKDIIQ